MLSSLALAVLLSVAAVQDDGPIATAAPILDDGPIATAAPAAETVDSQRVREAIAYSNPMPPARRSRTIRWSPGATPSFRVTSPWARP